MQNKRLLSSLLTTTAIAIGFLTASANAQLDCIDCHKLLTPGIVTDWELSAHSSNNVGCAECHGSEHNDKDNVALVKTIAADTCGACQKQRFNEFKTSKHPLAWDALKAMPTTHWKPMELIDGMKGCGGCHKIGLRSSEEITRLKSVGSG